ncbi:WLM domain [Phytophthora cactorum]|nr:WLM domain [Phytophthora cactorum]
MDSDTLLGAVIPLGLTLTILGLTLSPNWLLVFGVIVLLLYLYPPRGCISSFTNKPLSQKEDFKRIRAGSNSYKVHEDLEQPALAAEKLDQLNTKAKALIASMYDRYIADRTGLSQIDPRFRNIVKDGVIAMKNNFVTTNLEENIPSRSGGDTSYVIDKGDVFAVCLRDPNNSNRVDSDMNTLTFVMLHELSHLFTPTYGHDRAFWSNFSFVLSEAVRLGIYTPVNYKSSPTPYCGMVVSYSPLFDPSVPSYTLKSTKLN